MGQAGMSAKVLYMVGHHVRKGFYINCLTHGDGEPVKFFGEKRPAYVWAVVDRFNRMQQHKASVSIQLHPIPSESKP
jgi:hypothetical protein